MDLKIQANPKFDEGDNVVLLEFSCLSEKRCIKSSNNNLNDLKYFCFIETGSANKDVAKFILELSQESLRNLRVYNTVLLLLNHLYTHFLVWR